MFLAVLLPLVPVRDCLLCPCLQLIYVSFILKFVAGRFVPVNSNPSIFSMLRSRLAPTPSGYLHLGNGVNFVIAWLMVREAGGVLKLRIDDADCSRSRPEYIEDIFSQLDWLGITWDEGPVGPDDFARNHSQRLRFDRYRQVLGGLRQAGHVYPCVCSRRGIRKSSPTGIYPGTCREGRVSARGDHALRLHVPKGSILIVDGVRVPLCEVMGDFVVWRKDGLPAYQLASLVDDMDDRISLIVRGSDLVESTAAQLFLADKVGCAEFAEARFVHHPLVAGIGGQKLSKSDKALSLKEMRRQGAGPQVVYRAVADRLGVGRDCAESLAGLLEGCRSLEDRGFAGSGENVRCGERDQSAGLVAASILSSTSA